VLKKSQKVNALLPNTVSSANTFTFLKVNAKVDIALPWGNPTVPPQSVDYHMGSYSVTCHPTQVNAPKVSTSLTYVGARYDPPL